MWCGDGSSWRSGLGRDPTIEELAEELGLTREEVVEALNVSAPPLSLTVSSEEGGDPDRPSGAVPGGKPLGADGSAADPGGAGAPRTGSSSFCGTSMDKTQTQTAATAGYDPGTGLPPGKETAPRHAAETPVILLLRSTYLLSALRSLWLCSGFSCVKKTTR